jgi:nuclear transcription factor Y gamma
MIAAEAPVLFAKACEMFILELTLRSWIHTEENKWRTLQRNDIAGASTRGDIFDFLVDIVPQDELKVRVYTAFGIFSSTISMSDFLVDIVPWDKLRLEFTKLLVFFLVLHPCGILG